MFLQNLLAMTLLLSAHLLALPAQDKASESERQVSNMQNPDRLKLEITPGNLEWNESQDKLQKPYEFGEVIRFHLSMTNISVEPITVVVSDPYFQNRPVLSKDGQEVAYRKEVAEVVEAKDKEAFFSRNYPRLIEPGHTLVIGSLNLSDWYETLEAGNYQLVTRYRFIEGGDWIVSPSILFEVNPK